MPRLRKLKNDCDLFLTLPSVGHNGQTSESQGRTQQDLSCFLSLLILLLSAAVHQVKPLVIEAQQITEVPDSVCSYPLQ